MNAIRRQSLLHVTIRTCQWSVQVDQHPMVFSTHCGKQSVQRMGAFHSPQPREWMETVANWCHRRHEDRDAVRLGKLAHRKKIVANLFWGEAKPHVIGSSLQHNRFGMQSKSIIALPEKELRSCL